MAHKVSDLFCIILKVMQLIYNSTSKFPLFYDNHLSIRLTERWLKTCYFRFSSVTE